MTATSDPLVRIDHLSVRFRVGGGIFGRKRREVHAVSDVTLAIQRGEILGLVGESGSGKSTLGRAILRLVKATDGQVSFDGRDLAALSPNELRRLRRRMQMIFQDPYGSLDPRMTVGDTIAEPLDAIGAIGAVARRDRVTELLRMVGLDPTAAREYPHHFSGGQRQRIGVARALAAGPEFLVCDEPISSLDVSIQAQILNLLHELRSQLQLTYLFVAHDLAVVRHVSTRIAVMYLGTVVELSPTDDIFESAGHPYTRALLSAIPIPSPRLERARKRVILNGEIPSPLNPPTGCAFHTRCWLYQRLGRPETCRTERPELREVRANHLVACHYSENVVTSDVGVLAS